MPFAHMVKERSQGLLLQEPLPRQVEGGSETARPELPNMVQKVAGLAGRTQPVSQDVLQPM